MADGAVSTVLAFIDRINAHDPPGIVARCTPDHRFTDSVGAVVSGADLLERGWQGYFTMFPDYHIAVESMVRDGDLVLLCGWASASVGESHRSWRVPAAWRALVRGERVAEWQVFADNGPVRDLMRMGSGE